MLKQPEGLATNTLACMFHATHAHTSLPRGTRKPGDGRAWRSVQRRRHCTPISLKYEKRQPNYWLALTERATSPSFSANPRQPHMTSCCQKALHLLAACPPFTRCVYIVHAEWITLRPTRMVGQQTDNAGLTTWITKLAK